ncbi:flavodoxin reductase [Asinibacterium sp. OR53]|uniref:flavodoxin reductase n=1 Tax=Asinibacterium sp. OR53 TaxID=925409 RepID=UPI00047AE5B4|nr:flavodoxin reductase [Asinibacterium sp. OR53]
MESYIVTIIQTKKLTHDVIEIRTEKPAGYSFIPGQATEVAINKKGWEQKTRPFTFTCLPSDEYLEFIIKSYPSHEGVTKEMWNVQPGDSLIIGESWGAINYKGKGLFMAGGAGITPFISIFRQLAKDEQLDGNRLLFANKASEDIILEKELGSFLGNNIVHVLSNEMGGGYRSGFITESLIGEYATGTSDRFYVCGPPPMMDQILHHLQHLGFGQDAITVEI